MWTLLTVAGAAFVVTNVDDLVVLTAFCGHERYRLREVFVGQYLGFGVLVATSAIGATGVATVLPEYTRWLGVMPVAVGVIWFLDVRYRSRTDAWNRRPIGRSRVGIVAGIGIADGADNVGVYVPLFAVLEPDETGVILVVFLFAAGIWVLFAQWLSNRPPLARRLEEYGDVVVPVVLVCLGVVILAGIV